MDTKINEAIFKSIKKANYYSFFINHKSECKNNILINEDNRRKLKAIKTINISPLSLSFEPEEKKNKKNLFIGKKYKNNKILSAKLGIMYKYIQNGKLKIINNKKLSFSKFSNNNYKENNLFIHHKKIDFSNPINYPLNIKKIKKLKNNSGIHFDESKKYKTIFIKYNSNSDKNKYIFEESNYFLEAFPSKYNNNLTKEKKKKTYGNNNKLFQNEEINKVKFDQLDSCVERNKYSKTELSITNIDNKFLKNDYFKKITSTEKINDFKLFKPIFFYGKEGKIQNLKQILQKSKNNPKENTSLFANFINKKKYISSAKLPIKNVKTFNSVKYSPINLNMLAQIPNRIIIIDKHRNEVNGFENYKNYLIKNKNNKKQRFQDIKNIKK